MSMRVIERLFQLAALVMFGVVVYLLLQKLTGHSPTVEDVLLGLVISQFSLFIAFVVHNSMFQGKMNEFASNTKVRLNAIEQKVDRLSVIEQKFDTFVSQHKKR